MMNCFWIRPVSPGNNKNYDAILRRGVELSGNLDLKKFLKDLPLKKFQLKADYNYQMAEFQDGAYQSSDVPMVPRHQAGLTLSAEWESGFGVTLSERMIGSRYAINDTGNEMSPEKRYFVTDIKFSYKKQNWETFLAVNNVFDRLYNEYVARPTGGGTATEYYAAPERNFLVGMKIKF